MATHLRTELVLDALDMALWQRRPDEVIHHSDQGKRRGNQKRRLKRSTVHGSGVAPRRTTSMAQEFKGVDEFATAQSRSIGCRLCCLESAARPTR